MTDNVVDLSEIGQLAAIREAAAAERAELQSRVKIVRWDQAMTRAFKGIFPRSQRIAWLKREHERMLQEQG